VPIFARLLRSSMISQRSADYILSAQSLGLSRRTITMSHLLPNSMGPVIVQGTLTLATAVIDAAALSFLGLGGGKPQTAEWGRMLTYAQNELAVAPQLAFLPGICIAITALGFTLLGESLREALDPKTRKRCRPNGELVTGGTSSVCGSGRQEASSSSPMFSSLPGMEASSLRVYGCRGLEKTSSEDAASTSSPSFMTHT
jgi:hypothetical protein